MNKYQELRAEIIKDTKFSSDLSVIQRHRNYNELKNLSNIYLNLLKEPSWVDILLADSILNVETPDNIKGYFHKLCAFYINEIELKFNK